MEHTLQNMEEILSGHISGFHQYCLTEPVHLCYVSRNLCEMTGYSRQELLSEDKDLYESCVHPADRMLYRDFLGKLCQREQTLTAQYRIVKKDGGILYVSDSATSVRLEDGTLAAYSVLTDITELKNENENLRFLNETIPCGFLKYTCEKNPRVTYINDQMLRFLRLPEQSGGEFDNLEVYKQNIYTMIPMEERQRFSRYLSRVYELGAPLAGEITVLRCDGTKARLFGWVTKCVNEQGEEEFQSACMDITQQHHIRKEQETKRYLKALTDVYDKIFEYDLSARTVKCLYAKNSPMFRWMENVPMQMEEATDKWIISNVFHEDREKLRQFFDGFFQKKLPESDTPPVIRYRAFSSGGTLGTYTGLLVKIDSSVSLFCCRSAPDTEEADSLRSENTSLRGINENMQKLVMRFTDGLAAFEILDDMVTPLYASENVCDFFGFTRDQWISIMKKRTPVKEFVSRSKAAYEDFIGLLKTGEAEFTYYDLHKQRQRRIKAICSQKSPGGAGPRYVMLYNIDDGQKPARTGTRVSIRTFGYFDVFVDEKPIAFRNEKSKELFALLVDRRGGYVSSEEAISFLWEDEPANSVTLARYRKVALRLKNILEEYGISDIVESVNGKRRLVTERVQCDLYDYLSGQEEFAQLFKGSYLTNYSWGENTLAELMGKHLY
ncbi:MAG: PAS domain-containing protein [Faecousia sp.]